MAPRRSKRTALAARSVDLKTPPMKKGRSRPVVVQRKTQHQPRASKQVDGPRVRSSTEPTICVDGSETVKLDSVVCVNSITPSILTSTDTTSLNNQGMIATTAEMHAMATIGDELVTQA